jgi:ESCRT-II complex subunit VPS36
MDRFEYGRPDLGSEESEVIKEQNVKLYNGNEKTEFVDGKITLTSHRVIWTRPEGFPKTLQLHLKYIKSLDEEIASSMIFGKKKRLIVRLESQEQQKLPGPMDSSQANFVKLSGPNGISQRFIQALQETLLARIWEISEEKPDEKPRIKQRSGILGIEKNLLDKQKQSEESINVAFQDLHKLIKMAKEIVGITKSISSKIQAKQGETSDDETQRFKSALMSLGIDDPVVKENFQNSSDYLKSLSREICQTLLDPIIESGGMMTITEVYCRINRARGLELVSPEDVLNACRLLNGPMRLKQYPSGALILQLDNHSDVKIAEEIEKEVKEKSISIEELARELNISILLAQERLLIAERLGKVCRDESVEGLRFYANLFI